MTEVQQEVRTVDNFAYAPVNKFRWKRNSPSRDVN